MMKRGSLNTGSNRRGGSLVYFVTSLSVMLGFCSMAVDLGRAQTAKTELRRVADAAARAAAYQLQIGASNTTVKAAAANMATNNPVDGSTLTISTANDVQIGNWSGGVFTNGGSPSNAVRVYARRIATNSDPISLLFASALGKTSVDVYAVSTANVTTVSQTVTVYGTSNLWLAGEPNGTQASEPDSAYPSSNHLWKYDIAGPYGTTDSSKDAYGDPADEPYASPEQISLTLVPGAIITITNVTSTTGGVRKAPNDAYNGADGDGSAENDDAATDSSAPGYTGAGNGSSPSDASGSEHNIANINVPGDALVGLFLDPNVPESDGTPPPGLDFSTSGAQNYTTLAPKTRQPFFVGNGQATGSVQQSITVPSDATRFYLGTMDGHEWSNNGGNFSVTVNQTYISLVQ